jgi:hypothetical protein
MFKKATRKGSKARIAITGPSGAGKTYTSMRIARGLAGPDGKIACIDTESGSASKYAGTFDFDVADLESPTVKNLTAAIIAAGRAGYDCLVIDSMTHAWKELLDQVQRIANSRFGGNTWAAWSEGTPLQQQLIKAILHSPCHVVATMRVKTEWVIEQNANGKNAPRRVGTQPEQGKGIEYEFDMLLNLTQDHYATVEKDRTSKFQDEIIAKPGEEFGKAIKDWLDEFEDDDRTAGEGDNGYQTESPTAPHTSELMGAITLHSIPMETQAKWLEHFGAGSIGDLTAEQCSAIMDKIGKSKETA